MSWNNQVNRVDQPSFRQQLLKRDNRILFNQTPDKPSRLQKLIGDHISIPLSSNKIEDKQHLNKMDSKYNHDIKYEEEPELILIPPQSVERFLGRPQQQSIEKFLVRTNHGGVHSVYNTSQLIRKELKPPEKNKNHQTQQKQVVNPKVINMDCMTEQERRRTIELLERPYHPNKIEVQMKRQMETVTQFAKKMNDQSEIERGKQIVQDFLRDEMQGPKITQAIRRRNTSDESARLNTYNRILREEWGSDFGTSQRKPLVEFNMLLKYLFQRSYHLDETTETEHKVIPPTFASAQEYTAIFEYLFLNEASAQLQQELVRFSKEKRMRYRKLQVRVDETMANCDGTVLCVAPKQTSIEIIDDDNEKEKKGQQDENCDLFGLKNYMVILAQGMDIDIKLLNSPEKKAGSFVFGWLIDPEKCKYLNQIRILTFTKNFNNNWTDVILMPFAKLTTIIREFMMLKRLDQVENIAPIIYNPTLHSSLILQQGSSQMMGSSIPNPGLLVEFFKGMQANYNLSQFQSIREITLIDRGICLLQGPVYSPFYFYYQLQPGTGKTHTLIGLVSAVYNYMLKSNLLGVRKIMICAPSNAAINEVLLRIGRGGVKNEKGECLDVRAIRIGQIDETSDRYEELRQYSLEDQAQRLTFTAEQDRCQLNQRTSCDIRSELVRTIGMITKKEKKKKSQELDGVNKELDLVDKELDGLYKEKRKLQSYLEELKGAKRRGKEKYQAQLNLLLDKAEIICCTLASSGSDKLDRFLGQIEILIVDEAAQCTEPTNIIPLRLHPRKMVLVGDPKQLPATTFSPISSQTLFNRSLFERITLSNIKPYLLDVQYRMHPDIRRFPSQQFYDNKHNTFPFLLIRLKDHQSILQRTTQITNQRAFLIDCSFGREQFTNNSYTNNAEALVITSTIHVLRTQFPTLTIGVVSGYKSQVKWIKDLVKSKYPEDFDKTLLTINTIDSFQGQEKDAIIFSCVRSSSSQKVGFMSDQRRINVALTRARELLIVVGDCITLCSDPCWKEFINNMIFRGLYLRYNSHSEQFLKQSLLDKVEIEDKTPGHGLQTMLNKQSKNKQKREVFNLKDFTNQHSEQQQIKQNSPPIQKKTNKIHLPPPPPLKIKHPSPAIIKQIDRIHKPSTSNLGEQKTSTQKEKITNQPDQVLGSAENITSLNCANVDDLLKLLNF